VLVGQPHQGLLSLVRLLERPPIDAAAAEEVVQGVREALTPQKLQDLQHASSSRAAMQSSVAAALQCAGWLVASRRRDVLDYEDFFDALALCMQCSTTLLDILQSLDEGLMMSMLDPSESGHVPGRCFQWSKGDTSCCSCTLAPPAGMSLRHAACGQHCHPASGVHKGSKWW
jgi:hypothetical protein